MSVKTIVPMAPLGAGDLEALLVLHLAARSVAARPRQRKSWMLMLRIWGKRVAAPLGDPPTDEQRVELYLQALEARSFLRGAGR